MPRRATPLPFSMLSGCCLTTGSNGSVAMSALPVDRLDVLPGLDRGVEQVAEHGPGHADEKAHQQADGEVRAGRPARRGTRFERCLARQARNDRSRDLLVARRLEILDQADDLVGLDRCDLLGELRRIRRGVDAQQQRRLDDRGLDLIRRAAPAVQLDVEALGDALREPLGRAPGWRRTPPAGRRSTVAAYGSATPVDGVEMNSVAVDAYVVGVHEDQAAVMRALRGRA